MKRLSSIAPVWAQRLKSTQWLVHARELQNFSECIVGEAWRYSDEYTKTCYACNFYGIRFSVFHPNSKEFNEVIKNFEEHFNKEHLVN